MKIIIFSKRKCYERILFVRITCLALVFSSKMIYLCCGQTIHYMLLEAVLNVFTLNQTIRCFKLPTGHMNSHNFAKHKNVFSSNNEDAFMVKSLIFYGFVPAI